MSGYIAQAWKAVSLNDSPLLADMTQSDRSWGRFLLAVPAGLIAGVVLAAVVALAIGIAAVVALSAAGVELDPQAWLDQLQSPDFQPSFSTAIGMIWAIALINGIMMFVLVWVASLITRKPLRRSFTLARRWRWRQLVGGMALYGLMVGALLAGDAVLFGHQSELPILAVSSSPGQIVLFAVLALVGLTIAAGAEELVFRGWFLRHTAVLARAPWLYILLNGVVFSAIHLDFDPNAFLARTAMGCGFAWMALRLGGIEFCTGAHTINNLLIVLFIQPLTLAVPAPEPFSAGLTGETLLMLAMLVGVTELVVRNTTLRAWMGGPTEPAQTAFD